MSAIGERLREEVFALGGIAAAARIAGSATNTIYNWIEKGNVPADKLMLLAAAGADVAYILTGVRAAPPLAPPPTVEEPAGGYGPDPLARRKAAIKTMVDMLDDPAKLAGFQAALEELERVKRLEQRLEELERKAG